MNINLSAVVANIPDMTVKEIAEQVNALDPNDADEIATELMRRAEKYLSFVVLWNVERQTKTRAKSA
jgi:hypothetical protein